MRIMHGHPVESVAEWIIFAACLCLDSTSFPKSIIVIWIYTGTFALNPHQYNAHATKLQNITAISTETCIANNVPAWMRDDGNELK